MIKTSTAHAAADHITTKDLPTQIRPRERMARVGPANLSDSELIAVILGTGTRGMTSIRLAEEVMRRYDGHPSRLGTALLEELSAIPGIGPAKASQILAAFELGKRATTRDEETKESMATPAKIAGMLMPRMRDYEQEHFVAIVVDRKLQLIKTIEIAIGGLSAAIIHPREPYKAAIRLNGSGLIVAHNHPSGDASPSREDIVLTRRLAEAGNILGIDFIDHIVIGNGCWVSLKEQGYF